MRLKLFVVLVAAALRRRWLWRGVELPRFDHVFLIVIRPVTIDVNFNLQLVLLAVADVARVERETVLTSQQRIDAAQYFRQLALERHRKICAASFLRESLQGVVSLQPAHASRRAEHAVSRRKLIAVNLLEHVQEDLRRSASG